MIRGKILTYKFKQSIILVLLFLANMNVANGYVYFLFLAGLISVLMSIRRLQINGIVAVLVFFSLCYLLFYLKFSGTVTILLKQFLYPLCYLIGLNFINKKDTRFSGGVEQQLSMAIFVCAMGAFGHYLINMSINFSSNLRNNVDFWTGKIVLATGQAALAVFAVGMFTAWLFDNKNHKLFAVVGLLLIMWYNLVLAGRTLILMIVLLLGVAFFYTIRTRQSCCKRKLSAALILVFILALTAYVQNWAGVREYILESNLSLRFDMMSLSDDQRLRNKLTYISLMLDYPFGGGTIRNITGCFAHELYLDVYSDAGVVAFLLIIGFAIDTFLSVVRVVRRGDISEDTKLLVLCVFLAIFLEFFLEPIIQGLPWMFCTFCFFSGMLKNVPIVK